MRVQNPSLTVSGKLCYAAACRVSCTPTTGQVFDLIVFRIGCASLQISLRYAKPYRPVGKGKIERFNRTVRMQFLPDLPQELTLDELNTRWNAYVNDIYHQRVHGSTGQTPLNRFLDDVHLLRGAPEKLPDYFRLSQERTVAKDRTIRLEGRIFEAPVDLQVSA